MPFQSTHPVWGGTTSSGISPLTLQFQSTHPVWGGTSLTFGTSFRGHISIHPPRVGWDGTVASLPVRLYHFNPPTPCGVGRELFRHHHGLCGDFNPPTPCGVGRQSADLGSGLWHFNPPTPCGVGPRGERAASTAPIFQSTHPVWGGTTALPNSPVCLSYFNPPTPCGVGLRRTSAGRTKWTFQSTHPVWGGTARMAELRFTSPYFNPPTPCGVGHVLLYCNSSYCSNFNPPTPCGVGQLKGLVKCLMANISIHPPRVGWDQHFSVIHHIPVISIHPPRVGWDGADASSFCPLRNFNPPTPCGVGQQT